jgi:hypothetical protein
VHLFQLSRFFSISYRVPCFALSLIVHLYPTTPPPPTLSTFFSFFSLVGSDSDPITFYDECTYNFETIVLRLMFIRECRDISKIDMGSGARCPHQINFLL